MPVFFSILILALTLLGAPLRVGAHIYINVFENEGFLKVYFFGIRVFHARIYFVHTPEGRNDLILAHGKKKNRLHLNNDPTDDESVAAMMHHPMIVAMRFEKLSAHFTVGKTGDAFTTVALLQTLRVLFYGFVSMLKCKYNVAVTESFLPAFDRDLLHCDVIGIITASIADIIFSFMSPVKKREVRSYDITK